MTATVRFEDLEPEGFASVIVTSADVSGRPVGKRFSVEVFRRLVHEGVALSSCVLGWDVDQWPGPVQEYTGHHTGWHDVRLRPDLDTLRAAAWLERTAVCVADFVELGSEELVPVAPRTILRRAVERVRGLELHEQVATEIEFGLYVGSSEDGRRRGYETLEPTTLARADYTIQAGDRYEGFFGTVRDALAASGLRPWTTQVEWGLGQWEINLEHADALEMADRHMLFKLAIRALAARAGMAATFMARPFGDTTGSSCHVHLSLLDADERNVFHDGEAERGVSPVLHHAVGGLLAHAPECMLFYAPTVNSYRRTTSGEFSGNGLSWGYDTRMASCRVLAEGADGTRLEWRVPGADVDPYLAIAAVLASTADGIERGIDPGAPLMGRDYEREVPPLPATLGEAVERFRQGPFPAEAFGKDVVAHYAEAGRWEWSRFLAPDAVTEWERRRYFDVI
ncbi:MAG: glutamine synthetase family protein [Candidatus Velamenicoccus archaeovorus]